MPRPIHRGSGRTRAFALSAALVSGVALPGAGLWAGTATAFPGPSCSSDGGRTSCSHYGATLRRIPPGTMLSVFPGGAGSGRAGGKDASGGGSGTDDTDCNSGGGGAARGAGGGGGSAFPRSASSIGGISVDPEIFLNEPHAGNGDVTISYGQRFPFPLDARSHFQLPADLTIDGTASVISFLPGWLEAGKHADLTVLREAGRGCPADAAHRASIAVPPL